jgi:hypothetical protein
LIVVSAMPSSVAMILLDQPAAIIFSASVCRGVSSLLARFDCSDSWTIFCGRYTPPASIMRTALSRSFPEVFLGKKSFADRSIARIYCRVHRLPVC